MSPELLHILQHSLGVDKYGQHPRGHIPRDEGDGCGPYYRNRFATDQDSDDCLRCRELTDMGFMQCCGMPSWMGGMVCYVVTPEGMEAMRDHTPKPPKVSKARERYLYWRGISDVFPSFIGWLKWKSTPEGKDFYA